MFLRKYGKRFAKFIFFFHGHEVVRVSKVYPESYDYKKSESKLYRKMRDVYDKFKLWIWHDYFPKVLEKSCRQQKFQILIRDAFFIIIYCPYSI